MLCVGMSDYPLCPLNKLHLYMLGSEDVCQVIDTLLGTTFTGTLCLPEKFLYHIPSFYCFPDWPLRSRVMFRTCLPTLHHWYMLI